MGIGFVAHCLALVSRCSLFRRSSPRAISMSSDSHYSAVDDPEAHPPTSARRSSRADMEESAGSSSTNIEVKLLPSSSEEVNPFDTESVPRSPSQAAQWHSGDLNEPLYTEASSSNSVLPPLFPSLGPLVATTAHPSTAGSWTSKISFYLFLIVSHKRCTH
jgi:hypothetical protein